MTEKEVKLSKRQISKIAKLIVARWLIHSEVEMFDNIICDADKDLLVAELISMGRKIGGDTNGVPLNTTSDIINFVTKP